MDLILWSHAIVDGVDNMQKSGVLKHQKSQVYQTFVRRPKWEKKAKAAIEQFPNKSICEAVRTEHHQALVSHFKTTRGTKIKREAANEKNQVRQVSNCERAVWRTVSARKRLGEEWQPPKRRALTKSQKEDMRVARLLQPFPRCLQEPKKKAIVSFTRLIYLLCLSEPQFFSNDTAIERRPYGPVPIKILKLMQTISIDAWPSCIDRNSHRE